MIPKSKFLYHYTRSETLIEFILPSLQLKLSSLKNTNDPKENTISRNFKIQNLIFAGDLVTIMCKLPDLLDNHYKICCFSGDYIDKKVEYPGFNLPRMWATYGDNHKGVCLKINLEKFCIENSVQNQTHFLRDIKYSSRISNNLIKSRSNLDVNKLIRDNLRMLFFEKHNDWKSEREIRYVSLEKKEYCSIKDSLDSVLLGEDFNLKYLPSIKNQLGKDSIVNHVKYQPEKGQFIISRNL